MFANRTIRGRRIPCVAFYLLAVLAIIVYGALLRRSEAKDPLAQQIYDHPVCQNIDGWSISHLIFFGALGVLYPGQHLQFLTVGILWEMIETGLGQNELMVSGKRLQLVGDQDEEGRSTGNKEAFWYGKESDIVMDIVGYSIGSSLASRYWPNPLTQKC